MSTADAGRPISTDDPWRSLIQPTAPHDDLPFEELARRYNRGLTSDRRGVLVRLLIKEAARRQRPVRALDVGCGTGISEEPGVNTEYLQAVRAHVDELWGIEPDSGVTPAHGLIDHFQHATMENAKLPENYFDLAYSYFVMEHVGDAVPFMSAVHRCLKPGGTYIFMTVNAHHYFTRIAKFLKRIRLDEWVLRKMRGAAVEEYHYPVRYNFNATRRIAKCVTSLGFEQPEFAFIERVGGPRGYFKGPTVAFYHLLEAPRRLRRSPTGLLEMVCRVTKKA